MFGKQYKCFAIDDFVGKSLDIDTPASAFPNFWGKEYIASRIWLPTGEITYPLKAEYDRINYTLAGRTDDKFREEVVADKVQNPSVRPPAMPPPDDKYNDSSAEHARDPDYSEISADPEIHMSMPFIDMHYPWGKKSWIVKYNGPYENYRNGKYVPMHVELVDAQDEDDPQNLFKTMRAGTKHKLIDLKKTGRWIRWTVAGCRKRNGDLAHFTVHHGPKNMKYFDVPDQAPRIDYNSASADHATPMTPPEVLGKRGECKPLPSTPEEAYLPPKVTSHENDHEHVPSTPDDAKTVGYERLRSGRRIHEENGRYYFYDTIGRKYECDDQGNKMWTSKRRPPQYDSYIYGKN